MIIILRKGENMGIVIKEAGFVVDEVIKLKKTRSYRLLTFLIVIMI